mgnify:FL=1
MTDKEDPGNIVHIEFSPDGPKTPSSVIKFLSTKSKDIVGITCIVEFDDGRMGLYANDKDIYSFLFEKKFLEYFIDEEFKERIGLYTEEK